MKYIHHSWGSLVKVLCFFSYYGKPRRDSGCVGHSSKPVLHTDAIMIHVLDSSGIEQTFKTAVRRHFSAFSDRMVGSIPISFWLDAYLPENGLAVFRRPQHHERSGGTADFFE